MEIPQKIAITIHFRTKHGISAVLLSLVVTAIEQAAYRVELQELEEIVENIPELPSVAIDAARHRIQEQKGHTLRIVNAEPGSIVVYGVVTALSLWILNNTLGETLKEAWKNSDFHHRLRDFLSSPSYRVRDKAFHLGTVASKKITRDRALRSNPPEVGLEVKVRQETVEMVYTIIPGEPEREPPMPEEVPRTDTDEEIR